MCIRDRFLRFGLLIGVRAENDGAVLGAHVSALPVERSGVVCFPEDVQQLVECDHSGIEDDAGHLRVPRAAGADFLVGGIQLGPCLLYTSPSPRDRTRSRMPSSA